jgi:hypothetical protein
MALVVLLAATSLAFAQPPDIDGLWTGQFSQAYVNPGGLGDMLLYGYYNVRGNLNLFNIVNTSTTDGEKVRVIFRNAKDSRECLDFSICLSRGDVWTAFLIDNGTTAAVCPVDTDTITSPVIPASCQSFKFQGGGGLTGVTADDCREGYFEVVGMTAIQGFDHTTCPDGTACIVKNDGECSSFNSGSMYSGDVANVLSGNNGIADLSTLATYEYNATAVADGRYNPIDLPSGRELSIPFAMEQGCNEADFIFTKSEIISPYDLVSSIGGETEMVVTFPTKRECHLDTDDTNFADQECDAMFNSSGTGSGTCCVPIGVSVWDDQENEFTVSQFSPAETLCLPYETNVIRLGGSNIWSSTVASILSAGSFQLGWVNVDLYDSLSAHSSISDSIDPAYAWFGDYDIIIGGLPAVAYTSQSFLGGAASYMAPVNYRVNQIGWY